MINKIKYLLKALAIYTTKKLVRYDFKNQKFTRFNERAVEYGFTFNKVSEIYPKSVCDVGTGGSALPSLLRNCGLLVTAIDNVSDYWEFGLINHHYHVIDNDITKNNLNMKFDLVTCISVLEHISNHDEAIKGMTSLLNIGGHLILTCPYTENKYYNNVYQIDGSTYGKENPFITQSFSRDELNGWLRKNNLNIIDEKYFSFWTGECWTVGKQIVPPIEVSKSENHNLICLLLKKV